MTTTPPSVVQQHKELKMGNPRQIDVDSPGSQQEGNKDDLPVSSFNVHRNHLPLDELKYRLEEQQVNDQSRPIGHNIKNVLSPYPIKIG
jgi:hypothetical protein